MVSVGALALLDGATFPSAGVALAGVLGAGFAFGKGISLTVDCVALGSVTGVFVLDGSVFTSPIALCPAGAATISTDRKSVV